jgi:hypothetical protein
VKRAQLLSWFGLLGAPFAWAGMHVTGYALTEAACSPINSGGGLHLDAWTAVVTALAAVTAVAGELAAIVAWRQTRSASADELPGSRVQFVAVMGMTFTPLFFAIILMSGLGVLFLPECVQS